MYLLTMGWFLAHTSLAMTPEHSATNGENSSHQLSRALQEHVPLITQSSSVTEPTHTHVARQAQMAALLNWQQMRPHAKSQNPLQRCIAHGDFPFRMKLTVSASSIFCRRGKRSKGKAQRGICGHLRHCHNLALRAPVYDSNNGPWRHPARHHPPASGILAPFCDSCFQSSAPDLRVPSSIQGTQKASVTEHLFTTSRPRGSAPIQLGRQGWCYLWLAAGKGECHNLALKAPVYDSNNGPWRHLAPFCDRHCPAQKAHLPIPCIVMPFADPRAVLIAGRNGKTARLYFCIDTSLCPWHSETCVNFV